MKRDNTLIIPSRAAVQHVEDPAAFMAILAEDLAPDEAASVCRPVAWQGRTVYPASPWRTDGMRAPRLGRFTHFSISAFRWGQGAKFRRRTGAWTAGLAILLDDVGVKVEARKIPRAAEPTWRIETSPGSWQWGYLLDPVLDLSEFDAAIRGIAVSGFTDPGGNSVGRLGRLPGSIKPGKNTRAGPALMDVGRTWELTELLEALGVEPATRRRLGGAPPDLSEIKADTLLDPVARWLLDHDRLRGIDAGGWWQVQCPWGDEHSGEGLDEAWFLPGRRDAPDAPVRGRAFKCFHSCNARDDRGLEGFVDKTIGLIHRKWYNAGALAMKLRGLAITPPETLRKDKA